MLVNMLVMLESTGVKMVNTEVMMDCILVMMGCTSGS